MAITSITLTNPGAETGDTTGWTLRSGSFAALTTETSDPIAPHAGSYFFSSGSSATTKWDQQVAVPGGVTASVDAGTAVIKLSAYHRGFSADADYGHLYIEFYAVDGTTLLGSANGTDSDPNAWTLKTIYYNVPVNTRFIRVGTLNTRAAGTVLNSYWDDFALEISNAGPTDYAGLYGVFAHQLGVYALFWKPTAEVEARQTGVYSLAASETSTTLFKHFAHQLGVYALCLPNRDSRKLRAWTFTQDDHDFYVLQLGSMTLVYDKNSQQWSQWKSPEFNYWRGADGCGWEGFNVSCDTETGKVWKIDASNRLDYGTTPITSQVFGILTERFRINVPCYMAELALSEGSPPSGVDAGEVSLGLRTSADDGQNWYDHGTVPSTALGEPITVRWYGLGLMKAPGHLFEITDTGYARRIDAFNIEVGNANP
jgi:hypothetical protein